MMTDDFDDLIPPPTRKPRAPRDPLRSAVSGHIGIKSTDFMKPVTQQFLAEVFGMDPKTVKKRLIHCPMVMKSNRALYEFKTACEYLLKPRMDEATFMKTLNAADLPPIVNKVVWEAKRIKLKYEIEAGQAWSTDDVLEVFGEVFMAVKSHAQLWAESMRELDLGDEANRKIEGLVDGFSADLHSKLVEMPKQRQTRSKIAELENASMPTFADEDDEE